MKFGAIVNINEFSVENLEISEIIKISRLLPKSSVIDTGIAERHLISTIEAQDLCQEKIAQVDKFIGLKKINLDKVEAESALIRAKEAGHKTAKEREWFTQSDLLVIKAREEIELARVCKSWLENKVKYFSMWHYSLKSFLSRDHNILLSNGGNTFSAPVSEELGEQDFPNRRTRSSLVNDDEDIAGEIEWK
jgi:hypothetical protein